MQKPESDETQAPALKMIIYKRYLGSYLTSNFLPFWITMPL